MREGWLGGGLGFGIPSTSSTFPEKQQQAAAAEEGRKEGGGKKWSQRGAGEERVKCSSVSLSTAASTFLASSQCPFHSQRKRDRPFPSYSHSTHPVLPLQYLNRQRKLAVATCSATRPPGTATFLYCFVPLHPVTKLSALYSAQSIPLLGASLLLDLIAVPGEFSFLLFLLIILRSCSWLLC